MKSQAPAKPVRSRSRAVALRRQRDAFLPWVQLVIDVLVIEAGLRASFWLLFTSGLIEAEKGVPDYAVYRQFFNLTALVLVFFLRYQKLYRPANQLTFIEEASRVARAVLSGFLLIMAATFFVRAFSFSRSFLVVSALLLGTAISLARFLLGLFIMWVDRSRGSQRNILVIGTNDNARKLIKYYRKNPRLSAKVTGFLDETAEKNSLIDGVPVLGKPQDLPHFLLPTYQVHEVVLALPGYPQDKILGIIYECEKRLVAFQWASGMFGLITAKMTVAYRAGVPLLSFTDSPLAEWENRFLKRSMDLLLSLAGLIVLLPVYGVIALLIKIDSPGPVFYLQRRVGEDGRRFQVIKFRTMRKDAEASTGPVWAKENDNRRTRLGEFLRRNNLDELPQLWNVFAGDMSLVGPRPERPFFVRRFKEDIPRYMARHTIRSGLTGWAQVNGLRGNTSIEERTKYDLYYIENWSLLFDIKILFMTLFARQNAY